MTYLSLHLIANKTLELVHKNAPECTFWNEKIMNFLERGHNPLLRSVPSAEGVSPPHILPLGAFSISRTLGTWPHCFLDKSNTDVNALLQYTDVINRDITKPSHNIHICNYTMITSTDRHHRYIWIKVSINKNIIKQQYTMLQMRWCQISNSFILARLTVFEFHFHHVYYYLIDATGANFNKICNIFSEAQTFKNPYRKSNLSF